MSERFAPLPEDWRSTPTPRDFVPPRDCKVKIVCAANRKGDIIFAGPRHCDYVMHSQAIATGGEYALIATEQGFIDQWGRFWNRLQAWDICQIEGQEIDLERNGRVGILFSEGLY